MVSLAARREAVHWIRERFGISERRACPLMSIQRSTMRYQSARDDSELLAQILELAAKLPRYGYRRIYDRLRRLGVVVNRKRVYRIYREANLAVRRKKRKKVAQANRLPRLNATKANEQWAMDFMSDSLNDRRRFRTLNVIDEGTRECLAIEVDTSINGHRVTRVLDRIIARRGAPSRIVVDNGSEFTGRALDLWAHRNGVELVFIRPGRPIENCFIESFNSRFRDECLDLFWFTSLYWARRIIAGWRETYNRERPHSSLGSLTPVEYAAKLAAQERVENAA